MQAQPKPENDPLILICNSDICSILCHLTFDLGVFVNNLPISFTFSPFPYFLSFHGDGVFGLCNSHWRRFFARSLSLAFSGAWGWSLFFGCNYVCMHRIGLGLGLCTGFLT